MYFGVWDTATFDDWKEAATTQKSLSSSASF